MSNILALMRITRDKFYDYYKNGIDRGVKREKKDDWKIKKIYNFFCQPDLIYDNNVKIYLGNSYNAANFNTLNNLNIECIINVSNEIQNYFPNNFEYFNIYIPDNNNCSIYHSFDNVLNFFHSQVNNNKKVFFIHCYYGASRSAIIVLLLLIKYYNLSFDNAKLLLEEKRKIVNINTTFLKELELYLQPEF